MNVRQVASICALMSSLSLVVGQELLCAEPEFKPIIQDIRDTTKSIGAISAILGTYSEQDARRSETLASVRTAAEGLERTASQLKELESAMLIDFKKRFAGLPTIPNLKCTVFVNKGFSNTSRGKVGFQDELPHNVQFLDATPAFKISVTKAYPPFMIGPDIVLGVGDRAVIRFKTPMQSARGGLPVSSVYAVNIDGDVREVAYVGHLAGNSDIHELCVENTGTDYVSLMDGHFMSFPARPSKSQPEASHIRLAFNMNDTSELDIYEVQTDSTINASPDAPQIQPATGFPPLPIKAPTIPAVSADERESF